MTRLTVAELRQLAIDNPELVARNAQALRDALRRPETHETTEGERVSLSGAPVDAADTLLAQIRILAPDMAQPIRDYPLDRFRIDLAYPSALLAIEVDGGQWKAGGGKHGGRRDYQKTRRITQAGWRLLRFTAGEVNDSPLQVIQEIRNML